MKPFTYIVLTVLLLVSLQALAVDPIVTVRYSNPEFNCANQTYTVDVEFQCSVPDKQLYSMNVRFYYPCDLLTFVSLGEFVPGYGLTNGIPPTVNPCDSATGINFFTFPGASVYVNGAIKKTGITSLKLSTTGWTKIFNITFQVIDTNSFNSSSFCPSLIWDLKEDLSGGFTPGNSGVVIALTASGATEHVQQFNWQYDGIPGEPYGFPILTNCISTVCGNAPKSYLPAIEGTTPGSIVIPVGVVDFDNIGEFSIAFDYDSTVLAYSNVSPNAIFNSTNGLMTVTNTLVTGSQKRITMSFDGSAGLTLADSSTLATLTFNSSCGTTSLTWVSTGNTCYYANAIDYPLWDEPFATYYTNGSYELEIVAPITKVDSTVATAGDLVTFTVRVWNFENIQSGTLNLDFDPTVLSFYQALPNSAIASGFTSQVVGSGRLALNWTANTSLEDGNHLAYLVFSNIGGVSPLTWYDNGTTCQYISSITMLPLNDQPTCNYYINGNLAPAEFSWTGESSNDWNESDNWEYGLVPDQFTDVIINTSSGRTVSPSFDGDFTLGVQCRNLTIVGATQFTVTGDFTIEPGCTLEMTGAGILHVGGDWTNSGTYIAGTGMVDFTGTGNSSIAVGVPPQNYVEAYILTETTKAMTPLTGASAGPSGDNAHSDVSIGFTFSYLGANYTQARINTNGWISLNLTGGDEISHDNTLLFENGDSPGTVIAPWWDDLNMDGSSSVSYKTSGTAPNRVFTAEWKNMLAFASGSTDRLNFQVKLHETTNVIEFCYGNAVAGTHNSLEGASSGIKDATGGLGNFLEASHNSSSLILPFLSDNINWPDVNYTFTPPVPSTEDVFYKFMVTKTGERFLYSGTSGSPELNSRACFKNRPTTIVVLRFFNGTQINADSMDVRGSVIRVNPS